MCVEVLGYKNHPTAQIALMFSNEKSWAKAMRTLTLDVDDVAQLMAAMKANVHISFGISRFEQGEFPYRDDLLTYGFELVEWYEIASEWWYRVRVEEVEYEGD